MIPFSIIKDSTSITSLPLDITKFPMNRKHLSSRLNPQFPGSFFPSFFQHINIIFLALYFHSKIGRVFIFNLSIREIIKRREIFFSRLILSFNGDSMGNYVRLRNLRVFFSFLDNKFGSIIDQSFDS